MPSEIIALVAPSGAGKSTLLHIAGLLEKPNNGEVLVRRGNSELKTSVLNSSMRATIRRCCIGFVHQFHHLLPEFSAIENVMIPQLIQGVDWNIAFNRAQELLIYLKLSKRLSHKPAELSGGECQRIAIARAIANTPNILLADEPTGNLDPQISTHVFEMLASIIRSTGLSAIIATHNAELVKRMDRKITLHNGEIEEL